MGRGITRRTAMTAVAGSLAALRLRATRAAGEKLRVGKAVVENVGFILLDVGMETGIFAKHGIAVEELNFAGGAKMAQAMTAGAVDISLGPGPTCNSSRRARRRSPLVRSRNSRASWPMSSRRIAASTAWTMCDMQKFYTEEFLPKTGA